VMEDATVYLEEQLRATHPFTPYLYVSNAVKNELSEVSAFERLTNTDMKKEMQQVLSNIKLRLDTRECTFAPRIINYPGGYIAETDVEGKVLKVEERLYLMKDKYAEKVATQRELITAEQEKEVTLRPKLPKTSTVLAERCYRRKNLMDSNSVFHGSVSAAADRDAVFSRLHSQASVGSRLDHKISRNMESYIFDRDESDSLIDNFNESNPLQNLQQASLRSSITYNDPRPMVSTPSISPMSSSPPSSPRQSYASRSSRKNVRPEGSLPPTFPKPPMAAMSRSPKGTSGMGNISQRRCTFAGGIVSVGKPGWIS
jgi:hypothetical protein